MRLPKRGERGFTLIELLIVVAILGVLAAVVIPNVSRFIGRGETEAAETELSNIQTAVVSMMVDNGLTKIPHPVDGSAYPATDNMSEFPDPESVAGSGDKVTDVNGNLYTSGGGDKDGFILYHHDLIADNVSDNLTNYVAMEKTTKSYTVDASGTVTQAP